jgi:hypothetical protein
VAASSEAIATATSMVERLMSEFMISCLNLGRD